MCEWRVALRLFTSSMLDAAVAWRFLPLKKIIAWHVHQRTTIQATIGKPRALKRKPTKQQEGHKGEAAALSARWLSRTAATTGWARWPSYCAWFFLPSRLVTPQSPRFPSSLSLLGQLNTYHHQLAHYTNPSQKNLKISASLSLALPIGST